ncbi:MAG: cell division protein FtsA, partial [Candidatus Acidiferrales bacterium]
MGKKDRYLVGLDIGSAKTCALVGEIEDEGGVKFAALGAAESKGWRKGQIVNLELAVSSIRRAVEEAENIVGVPVESALIGIAGSHVRGVNSRGGIVLGQRPRDINRDDVRRAVEAAKNVSLPEDREVLHVLPQEFFVDAQDNIRDAIGMVGQKLEANVHIVTSSAAATQNVITAVNKAGVIVNDTVLEPLASAEACLTQDERELGCCLLDIGGGTTELIVYSGGVVRHSAAVPIGGDHFTNDLAVGLRTPIPEAESIKREHAWAWHELMSQDTPIEIASVGDRPPRTVFARNLCEIAEPRANELLTMVRDDLRRAGLLSQIPAGLILTGGGARLRGLAEFAEKLFKLPVRLASPRGLIDITEGVSQPEYSAAVGLVLYG